MSKYDPLRLLRRIGQALTPQQPSNPELYCQSSRCKNPLFEKGCQFIVNADGSLAHTYCSQDILSLLWFEISDNGPEFLMYIPESISYEQAQELARNGQVKFTRLEKTVQRQE